MKNWLKKNNFLRYLDRFPKESRDTKLVGHEREFLPSLLAIEATPEAPAGRNLIWLLTTFVISALVWSYFGKIDIVTTARGRVTSLTPPQIVQPLETAIVKAIHVKEGQFVKQGQLLIELDNAVSEADLLSSKSRLTTIQSDLGRLRFEADSANGGSKLNVDASQIELMAARKKLFEDQRAELLAEVSQKKSELVAEQTNRDKYERLAQLSAVQFARFESLASKGFLSKVQLDNAQRDLATQQQEQKLSAARIQSLEQGIIFSQRKLETLASNRRTSVQTDLSKQSAEERIQQTAADKGVELKRLRKIISPADGWIQRVQATTLGAVVSSGQTLMTVIPSDTELVVDATIPSSEIGFIDLGQKVDVKIDTFPFTLYGTVPAKLELIARDAESTQARNDPATKTSRLDSLTSEGVYIARIRLSQQYIELRGKQEKLIPGMTTQVDIITDRRRILDFLVSPISKNFTEGLKVR